MRLFGTNGIREVVGERLTSSFAQRVASAIGSVMPSASPIVLGWDGRTSSFALSRVVGGTLALAGHHVIEVGLLPTPAIQYLVPRLHGRLGVIVTASHNPPEFNGVKCIADDGLEVPRSVEESIEQAVDAGREPGAPFDRIGTISTHPGGAEEYVDGILACVDRSKIAERRFSVVLDTANGASAVTSPNLLRRLGCRVRTLNGHIDGTFPGRPSEPTEANLGDLMRAVPAFGADLGIAHDGDADRAVFVDRNGRFVPGESLLTLLSQDAVERHHGGVVVTPVTMSQALADAITPLGGEVIYTRVGSPNVTREMQARHAILGGEENGGIVFPQFQLARDGAMAAASLLDLLARRSETLDALIAGVPHYAFVREKVPCPVERREEVLRRAAEALSKGADRVERTDGVKLYRGKSWILVRPSGTEPLVRIFAEANEPHRARNLADEGVRAVREALAAH